MATVTSFGTLYGNTQTKGGFSNEETWEKFEVNYASDATAVATNNEIFAAGEDLVVLNFFADVETALTNSETTGIFTLGIGAAGTHLWENMSSTGVNWAVGRIQSASTGLGSITQSERLPLKLTKGQRLMLSKSGNNATPTAGVLNLWFRVRRLFL